MLCVALYGSLLLVLTYEFESIGMFRQDDLAFDADAFSKLRCFAESKTSECRSFVHPNLGNFVTPVVWGVAGLGVAIFRGSTFLENADEVGTWIAPAAAVCAFLLCLACGLRVTGRRWLALAVAVGYAGSAAAIYFGSIPESYGLSGLVLWLALFFALGGTGESNRSRLLLWTGIGVIGAGITITNVVWTSLLGMAWALRKGYSPWTAIRFGSVSLLLSLAVTAMLWGASLIAIRFARPDIPRNVTSLEWHTSGATDWVSAWIQGISVRRAIAVGRLYTDAIAAPQLVPVPPAKVGMLTVPWQVRELSMGAVLHACGSVGAAILLCVCGIGSRPYRLVAIACSLILLGNGLLHLFWGGQPFLYAMHVLPILFGLVWIALSRVRHTESRILPLFAAGLVLAVVAYNVNHVRHTLASLIATIEATSS